MTPVRLRLRARRLRPTSRSRREGTELWNPNASAEVRQLRALEFRCEALRLKIEAKDLDDRARLLVEVEDSIPIIDWIRENLPELDDKMTECFKTKYKIVTEGIKDVLLAGRKVTGAKLLDGEIAHYSVKKSLLDDAKEVN